MIKINADFLKYEEILEIVNNNNFLSMKNFRHHGNISVLEHSLKVAMLAYNMSLKKNLDFISSTRAALLHDFYLYDWHIDSPGLHGFKHPKISLENAKKYFYINEIEEDAILRHMWPLTPRKPKFKESQVVSNADKIATYHDYKKILSLHITKIKAS